MSHPSFLNNFEEALLKLIQTNTVLAGYHWQRWDSDSLVELPRGYIELDQRRDVEHTPLFAVLVTITLEGKPERQPLTAVEYELESMICDDALCATLTSLSTTVEFYGTAAEEVDMSRLIRNDVRRLVLTCKIYAGPTQ